MTSKPTVGIPSPADRTCGPVAPFRDLGLRFSPTEVSGLMLNGTPYEAAPQACRLASASTMRDAGGSELALTTDAQVERDARCYLAPAAAPGGCRTELH